MIGGIFAGALTLIAMQVFASGEGPQRGGALIGWIGTGVQAFLSPDKAAIPNVNTPAKPAAGGSGGSPGTTTPPPGGSYIGPGGTPGPGVPVSMPRNPQLS